MDVFNKNQKLNEYDSNTLITKRKEGETNAYRIHVKELLEKGEIKEGLVDKNIEYNLRLPKTLKMQMRDKFNIKLEELEPFAHYQKKNNHNINEASKHNQINLNFKDFQKKLKSVTKDLKN